MADLSFIRLEDTLEKAFNLGDSPIVTHSNLGQIQLCPFDPKPYYQTTNKVGGVSLGANLKASFVDCDGVEHDILDHFVYEDLTDANNENQIVFRLAYLPKDHYSSLVYLKLSSDTNTYYSNRFLVTQINSHLTSRIDYTDPRGLLAVNPDFIDQRMSIRLSFYFNQHIDADTISTDYQLTTQQNVTLRVDEATLKEYYFEFCNYWTWRRLKYVMNYGRAYIDFERNQLKEAFEFQGRIGHANHGLDDTFLTDPNEDDTIIVSDVIIIVDAWTFDTADTFDSEELIFNQ